MWLTICHIIIITYCIIIVVVVVVVAVVVLVLIIIIIIIIIIIWITFFPPAIPIIIIIIIIISLFYYYIWCNSQLLNCTYLGKRQRKNRQYSPGGVPVLEILLLLDAESSMFDSKAEKQYWKLQHNSKVMPEDAWFPPSRWVSVSSF